MHENLYKNVNENMWKQDKFLWDMLQLCTANFLYGFNPFKMAVHFFWTASSFLNFDGPNAFPQVQQAPGPDFKKVGKSLRSLALLRLLLSLVFK